MSLHSPKPPEAEQGSPRPQIGDVVKFGRRADGSSLLVPTGTELVDRAQTDYQFGESKLLRPKTPVREAAQHRGPQKEDLALVERGNRLGAGTTAELKKEIEGKATKANEFLSLHHFDEQTRLTLKRMLVLGKNLATESPGKSSLLAYAYLQHLCIDDEEGQDEADSEREYAEALQEADGHMVRFVARSIRDNVFGKLKIDEKIGLRFDRLIVNEIIHGRIDYLKALLFQGLQSILQLRAEDVSRRAMHELFGPGEESQEFDPEIDIEEYRPANMTEKVGDDIRAKLAKILGEERAGKIIAAAENPDIMEKEFGNDLVDIFVGKKEDRLEPPDEEAPLPGKLSDEATSKFWEELDG